MEWFKKHKILSILIIVIGLAIIGSAMGGVSDNGNQSSNQSDQASDSKPETAKIGQTARDGKFEFTVKSIECGKKRVGNEFAGTDAQGQFCFLNITVENISDQPQHLFSDDQYLIDSKGNKYSADDEAWIYLGEAQQTIFEEINPGNTVKAPIIFDVPKGVKPTSAELHDSAFSGGVKVDLK